MGRTGGFYVGAPAFARVPPSRYALRGQDGGQAGLGVSLRDRDGRAQAVPSRRSARGTCFRISFSQRLEHALKDQVLARFRPVALRFRHDAAHVAITGWQNETEALVISQCSTILDGERDPAPFRRRQLEIAPV